MSYRVSDSEGAGDNGRGQHQPAQDQHALTRPAQHVAERHSDQDGVPYPDEEKEGDSEAEDDGQDGRDAGYGSPKLFVYARILITMLGPQVGGVSEETSTRIKQVAAKHPHFFELARAGTYDAEAMSQDQFVEIVEDGLRLYHCMTDDELRALQREAAHVLATFGESAADHEQ